MQSLAAEYGTEQSTFVVALSFAIRGFADVTALRCATSRRTHADVALQAVERSEKLRHVGRPDAVPDFANGNQGLYLTWRGLCVFNG